MKGGKHSGECYLHVQSYDLAKKKRDFVNLCVLLVIWGGKHTGESEFEVQ